MDPLCVIVAIPSGESWKSDFGMSLLGIVADFSSRIPGFSTQQLRFIKTEGSILPNSRQHLLELAVGAKATHLLFVDSDQTFPYTTLRRLLQWNKPIVACNIATKCFPSNPTARRKANRPEGELVYTFAGMTGLEQVWRVGMGVMLIELSVLRDVPKPWCPVRWRPDKEMYHGEDWGFCELMESLGIPLYVDHGLSWEVGHVGKLRFTHQMVEEPKRRIVLPGEGGRLVDVGSVI